MYVRLTLSLVLLFTTFHLSHAQDTGPLGIPAVIPALSGGHHGFNMGYRSNLKAVRNWPRLMADWMSDMNLLQKKGPR